MKLRNKKLLLLVFFGIIIAAAGIYFCLTKIVFVGCFNPRVDEPEIKATINSRAAEVISFLQDNNFVELSTYVHPQKGVRFSPYSYVNSQTDLVFGTEEIKNGKDDQTKYIWGAYDGSGFPIELTIEEYFKRFVYSHDFAVAPEVSYNRIIGKGNTINNVFDSYPDSMIIEYHFPGFDPQYQGLDWKSLILAFQEFNQNWYLVGIIHGEWTI